MKPDDDGLPQPAADPGFPREWKLLDQNLAKNLHENEENETGGCRTPIYCVLNFSQLPLT